MKKIRSKFGPKMVQNQVVPKTPILTCYLRMALLNIWGNGHLILYFLSLVYNLIWPQIKNQIKNRFRNSPEWRSFWEYQNDMSYTRGPLVEGSSWKVGLWFTSVHLQNPNFLTSANKNPIFLALMLKRKKLDLCRFCI